MFVAAIRQKVDGEWREPGDLVPEAIDWKNLGAYTGSGRIIQTGTPDETVAVIARLKGVEMDTIDLNELSGEAEKVRYERRNMTPRSATGGGLAPMADGSLREPLAGPVLERVLRQAGIPVETGILPTVSDAELKAEATAEAEGDGGRLARHATAYGGGSEARSEDHQAQAEEIEAAIQDATRVEGTKPSKLADATERAQEESIDRAPAEEQERLRAAQEQREQDLQTERERQAQDATQTGVTTGADPEQSPAEQPSQESSRSRRRNGRDE